MRPIIDPGVFWGRKMVRNRRFLLSIIALCALTATAQAGELLVMPFACATVGGEPQLTPSDDRGYAIVGRREERDFSVCSPANPTLCRNWKLYRFVIDCGGTRMPWASIVASARGDRRAWVQDGRLRIEMPARWAIAPDDACAPGPGNAWRGWGLRRFCAERRARNNPQIVEMPDGYAPMMGINAIFVADNQLKGTPSHSAVADREAPATAPAPTLRAETPKPAPAPRAAEAPTRASSPKTADALPVKVPPPKSAEPPAPAPVSASPERKPTATQSTTLPSEPVRPVIINRFGAQQAGMPTAAAPPEPPPPQDVETAPSDVVTASISTKAASASQTASIAPQSSAESTPPIVSALNSFGPVTIGAVSLTGLLLLALTFLRLRTRDEFALGANRDIGAMSLGGRDLVPARPRPIAAQTQNPAPAPAPGGPHPDIGSEIPETREQALRILGMGVTAGVSDSAIKKIVDGLRMSWHPDGATTEEERQLRELRMKQINAAWDIVSGRR